MCFVRSFNPTTLSSKDSDLINFALQGKAKLIKSLSGLGQLVGDYPQAPYVFLTQKRVA